VPRIVNLITMRANTGPRGLTFMQLKPKLYFNIRALFFFLNFYMWRIQFTNESCKKLLYQYFWLWRPQSLTHTVGLTLRVDFINIIRARFSYERHFGSFFSSYMYFTCMWKKLQKQCLYEKLASIKLMKLRVCNRGAEPFSDDWFLFSSYKTLIKKTVYEMK